MYKVAAISMLMATIYQPCAAKEGLHNNFIICVEDMAKSNKLLTLEEAMNKCDIYKIPTIKACVSAGMGEYDDCENQIGFSAAYSFHEVRGY